MKRRNVLCNEGGYFKFIFAIAVIAFLIYAGIQFGMPYYRYSSFKNDAKEFALTAVTGDLEKTKVQIFERAQELSLPLEQNDIQVTKANNMTIVKTSWSEKVYLLGQEVYTYNFILDIKE